MGKTTPKVNTCAEALRTYQAWMLDELVRWQQYFPSNPAMAVACFQAVVGRGLHGRRHEDGVVIGITPLARLGHCTPGAVRKVLSAIQEESNGHGYGEGFHEFTPANRKAGEEANWYIASLAPLPEGVAALLGGADVGYLFKRTGSKKASSEFLRNLKASSRRSLNSSGTPTSIAFSSSTTQKKTMTMAMVDGDGLGEEGLEKKKPALAEKQEALKARLMAEPCNLDCGGATEAARAVSPEEILSLLAVDDAFWAKEVQDASRGARPRRGVPEADRHKALLVSRVRNPNLRRELIQRAERSLRGKETSAGASGDYALAAAVKTWQLAQSAIPAEGHNSRQGAIDMAAEAWGVVERVYAESNPQAWEDLEAQVATEVARRGGSEIVQRRMRSNFRRKRLIPLIEAIANRLAEAA